MTPPHIDEYRFGHIVIDGQAYDKDVLILPDRTLGGWWRKEGHTLYTEDLETVFEAAPQTLVVGQGAHGRLAVPPETAQAIREAGLELIAHPTEKACQVYNTLRERGDVAAALHLTC